MMNKSLLFLAVACGLVACRGTAVTSGSPDGGASNDTVTNNGVATNSANNGVTPGVDGGGDSGGLLDAGSDLGVPGSDMPPSADVREPPVDLGSCGGASFGEAFTAIPVAGTTAGGELFAAATSAGGALLASANAGSIHITHVDGAGAALAEFTVAGTALHGLAAHDTGRAVLVARDPDILALVILDNAGSVISDQTVIGDVPHDVTENEWFGPLIRHGRLIWTGAEWAAYYPVQRLWNDGIAHYGDQLRTYAANGSSFQTVWGWGCSHSMDLRISHNGDRLGPVCSSDCYPSKGVHFAHRGGELWPDETGSNCAGGYGTAVGASVPVPGGFWAAFTAVDNRTSADVAITRIDQNGVGEPVWLTADTTPDANPNAVAYDGGLLVAWDADQMNQFVVSDSTDGSLVQGPVSIADADLSSASDFFSFANGDAGWAQRAADGSIALARLRACP